MRLISPTPRVSVLQQSAAADRLAKQSCHKQTAVWRQKIGTIGAAATLARIEATAETCVEFGEILREAMLHVGGRQGSADSISTPDARSRRSISVIAATSRFACLPFKGDSIDFANRSDKASMRRNSARPARRQAHAADAPVIGGRPRVRQPLAFERTQQTTEKSRVEPQARAQIADAGTLRADFEQQPRFDIRPVAAEKFLVQHAGDAA